MTVMIREDKHDNGDKVKIVLRDGSRRAAGGGFTTGTGAEAGAATWEGYKRVTSDDNK
jgi:hypothetical protein